LFHAADDEGQWRQQNDVEPSVQSLGADRPNLPLTSSTKQSVFTKPIEPPLGFEHSGPFLWFGRLADWIATNLDWDRRTLLGVSTISLKAALLSLHML
jgi:hypothetical protein